MTPEEAYEKARRRIREAKKTGAVALDLSDELALNRLPPELERLTSLQSLSLAGCEQLSGDLSSTIYGRISSICGRWIHPDCGRRKLKRIARTSPPIVSRIRSSPKRQPIS